MQTLLLVQSQINREMITQCLESCGHEVTLAKTVDEAFDLLENSQIELVFCDIGSEALDDEPFTARLNQRHPDIQLIVTTNYPTTLSEAVKTLSKGGYSFLVKTFEDAGLISATLNRVIDNVRVLTELRTRLEDLQKKNRELFRLHKTLKSLELSDALSGLRGQINFQESLGKELLRSLHNKSRFSLLLVGVRCFSGESDEEQPLADDKIAQLAQTIRRRLRRSDLITLYHAQTFGLLLPETAKDESQLVMRNLVELLEGFPFASEKSSHSLKVRVHFGLSSFPEDGASISTLMKGAEKELNNAYRAGGLPVDQHGALGPAAALPIVDVSFDADNPQRRVLVVDDEPSTCSLLSLGLADNGYEVSTAASGEDALKLFQDKPFPVVISDVMMPGMSGMDLMKQVKGLNPSTEVIIMTSHTSMTPSIKALRAGAFDFLPKPIEDVDIVPIIVERAYENFCRITEKQRLIAALERKNKEMSMANMALQHMVIRDSLTGLYNHSYFKEALTIEIVRSGRYQREFSVLFMDLDHFKGYNDTHGHPAGDQLLKTLSKLIGERLRKSDILARYGGEEFTAILPEVPKDEALRVAEDIRREVQNFPFPGRELQPDGQVCITIGVAAYPQDGETAEALIINADQALYRGKKQGRNRVCS